MEARWIGLGSSCILVAIWLAACGIPKGELAAALVSMAAALQLIAGYLTGKQIDQLRQLAYHDSLTGVLVNGRFLEKLEHGVDLARRGKYQVTLLFLDLDNFKMFNDKHGHIAGDKLLCQFAQVLQSCTGRHDLVGRWGGEEFVVLLDHCDTEAALALGEQMRNQVRQDLGGLTVSIGVATYPDHATDAGELTMIADNLMYEAKKKKDCILAASN